MSYLLSVKNNATLQELFVIDDNKEGTNILTLEQEINLEKNLVWIFGSPRSGTTYI